MIPGPGPLNAQPTLKCIGCKTQCSVNDQNNMEIEWICDICIDLIANTYDLDTSVDDFIQKLPKGVTIGHLS
jgi:hypothetical protein